MSDRSSFGQAFHLGRYVDIEQATVNVQSLAMRYGLSVFEGIRGYMQTDGSVRPFMLREHMRRLKVSAGLMGITDPGIDKLPDIISGLLQVNELKQDVYFRPSVHAVNYGDLGADPIGGLTVTVTPMGRKKWISKNLGMRVHISGVRKMPHDSFATTAKCISAYAGPFVANSIAVSSGFDAALLLNHSGYVTEAPTAALFAVRNHTLTHSPLSDGVLPSITAYVLRALAQELSIPMQQRSLRPEDLITADELFLCGTGIEIAGIQSVDCRLIGDYSRRPVTERLSTAYFQLARGERRLMAEPYDI